MPDPDEAKSPAERLAMQRGTLRRTHEDSSSVALRWRGLCSVVEIPRRSAMRSKRCDTDADTKGPAQSGSRENR
jgi:hypothetical protein